ncbi:unnamed protein product, partial [marine sediment metagenome]
MKHKHVVYLYHLTRDLNFICYEIEKYSKKEFKIENAFRLQVLLLHLHTDYLLNEIIEEKFKEKFDSIRFKDKWKVEGKDFIEKLKI